VEQSVLETAEIVVIKPLSGVHSICAPNVNVGISATIAGSRSPDSTRSWSTSMPIGRMRSRAVTRAGSPLGPDARNCVSTACLPEMYVVVETGRVLDS
jgi:hypothetical protein